jgi:endonuclease YncB( thermonuclease family)
MIRPVDKRSWKRSGGRRRAGRLVVALLLLLGLLAAYAYEQWSTRSLAPHVGAAWVADGDSIEISGARIRLQGIDAPELDQTCLDPDGRSWACGRTAAHELRAHIQDRELTCKPAGADRYQRILAICTLSDGSEVNAWMIRQGWAVASGHVGSYQSEQDEARAGKRGLWAGRFDWPWDWRRRHPE